jgi:hypothetical protein
LFLPGAFYCSRLINFSLKFEILKFTNHNISLVAFFTIILFSSIILLGSCSKDIDNSTGNEQVPDLVSKVNSSVSGFVTDENNIAASGAIVKAGTVTVTTDEYGYFEIKNVQVVKNAAVVTVTKAGYFNGIKTYIAVEGKSAFFRIKLLPKTNAGSIDGNSGGNVSLSNGLNITLPASAVVNATSNAPYSGTVNVAAKWIDPTSAELKLMMPGDLRGIDDAGGLKSLTTYGMMAVELTGAGGEPLQIATGKKATLTFPLPASIVASAPASIPLWYFDEEKGLWKQEGSATKTGNSYIGEVSHFSFWNCDYPNTYIQFDCTIKDINGQPIPFAVVRITEESNPINSRSGWTDSSGYVAGAIPDNANLLFEVFNDHNCITPVYSQNFNTGSNNISLGTISINNTTKLASVNGSITNCAGSPVTNGYVVLKIGQSYFKYTVNNSGQYYFTLLMCDSSTTVSLFARDVSTMQESAPLNLTLVNGINAAGNLQACGSSVHEYLNFVIDGTSISYATPIDHIEVDTVSWTTPASFQIFAASNPVWDDQVEFYFEKGNLAVGSQLQFTGMWCFGSSSSSIPSSIYTDDNFPISGLITITECGSVGEHLAGYFSGTFTGTERPTGIFHTVTGNFRIIRIL